MSVSQCSWLVYAHVWDHNDSGKVRVLYLREAVATAWKQDLRVGLAVHSGIAVLFACASREVPQSLNACVGWVKVCASVWLCFPPLPCFYKTSFKCGVKHFHAWKNWYPVSCMRTHTHVHPHTHTRIETHRRERLRVNGINLRVWQAMWNKW